jgi:colanic acid biosynthesis glycosyl transferase WcaI
MHLLILGMNYAPESTGIGPYTSGLAEFLARQGHRVTVATAFPHYPQWRREAGYAHGRRFLHWEQRNGVAVHRGWVKIPHDRSTAQRVLYDSSFALSALFGALPARAVDLILCISPPLQAALTAALLRPIHRAPVVLLVKDLVPDAATAVGMLRAGPALQLARILERYAYRQADGIIVIGEAFRANLLAKGVPPGRITCIPDWVDTERIRPLPRDNTFRQQQNIPPNRLVILHAGNMGAKQGLRSVIDAATLLHNDPDVQFLLVGDGNERSGLEALVRTRRLANVSFLPLQPEDAVSEMLAAADLLLLSQRPTVTDAVVPSKLLTYLAAGRPVLAAVAPGSTAARLVEASGGGIVVPPDDPAALAGAIEQWRTDASAAMGQRGRRYVTDHYGRQRILGQYERYLADAVREARKG